MSAAARLASTNDGQPVVANQSYRITVNIFLVGAGDGFSVLKTGTAVVTGTVNVDAMVPTCRERTALDEPALDRVTVQ